MEVGVKQTLRPLLLNKKQSNQEHKYNGLSLVL